MRLVMRYTLALLFALSGSVAYGQVDQAFASAGGEVTLSIGETIPITGLPIETTATFTFSVDATSIHLRPIGSSEAFIETPGVQDPNDPLVFRATIPGSQVTARGLELFVEYLSDGTVSTLPETSPESNPIRFPTLTPRIRAEVNLVPFRYRMISVPFQFFPEEGGDFGNGSLSSVFEDDFGPYNPSVWRVLRWDPITETYAEAEAAVPQVRPGEAFWVITSTGNEFDVEGGVTPGFFQSEPAGVQPPVRVQVRPGWNQVGNPFLSPMSWSDVQNIGLVEEPVGFDGQSFVPGVTTLVPWTGYFVYNPSSSPVELRFRPPVGGTSALSPAPFGERLADRAGAGAMVVQLVAQAGEMRDEHTYIGAVQGEAVGFQKPPAVEGTLRAEIVDDGGGWGGRLVPMGESNSWTVRFSADWPDSRPVTVTTKEHAPIPHGQRMVATELASGRVLPSPGGQFDVRLGGQVSERLVRFNLVPAHDVPGPDVEDRLRSPHPNPARPGVDGISIWVWGDDAAPASVEVFDLLGREVIRLAEGIDAEGWHQLHWSGDDASGRALPAGVYLLRYRAGSTTVTRSITLVR